MSVINCRVIKCLYTVDTEEKSRLKQGESTVTTAGLFVRRHAEKHYIMKEKRRFVKRIR